MEGAAIGQMEERLRSPRLGVPFEMFWPNFPHFIHEKKKKTDERREENFLR